MAPPQPRGWERHSPEAPHLCSPPPPFPRGSFLRPGGPSRRHYQCHPGSAARPPGDLTSPVTSQCWSPYPRAAERQRADRWPAERGPRRGKPWQTGSYTALLPSPKDQGGRREVSVSVGRSRHVETPPSGLGTTGHGPEVLRLSRAQRRWRGGGGAKVGSHLFLLPRRNGQVMRRKKGANITDRGRHSKCPKQNDKPHSNPTNTLIKRRFPIAGYLHITSMMFAIFIY